MPRNIQKFVDIIFSECQSIEERCDGYKKKLFNIVIEISALEREHAVQGTNIQQKINNICGVTGDFIIKNRK